MQNKEGILDGMPPAVCMLTEMILYFLRELLFSDSLLLLVLLLLLLCLTTVSFGALWALLRAEDEGDPADSCLEEDLEVDTLDAGD